MTSYVRLIIVLKESGFLENFLKVINNYLKVYVFLFLCLATIQSRENGVSFSENVNADEVLTNDGNGYNDRMGVFTCPIARSPEPLCLLLIPCLQNIHGFNNISIKQW